MKKHRPRILSSSSLALTLAAFVCVGLSLAARPAQARLIDLRAGVIGGGLTGWGQTANTPDFFKRRQGPGAGVEVGVKLLVFDVSASFLQLFNGSGTAGTLTQLLAGVNIDVPVGNDKFQEGVERGKSKNIIRPIANIGGAIGSPEPVHLPIDNAQISSKGLVSYWGVGYEHFINEFVGVGAVANFGYHYFVGGDVVNSASGHSSGFQLIGLGTFTFHLGYGW